MGEAAEGIGEERLELRGLSADRRRDLPGRRGGRRRPGRGAKELLAETRRSLYKILADDEPAD